MKINILYAKNYNFANLSLAIIGGRFLCQVLTSNILIINCFVIGNIELFTLSIEYFKILT